MCLDNNESSARTEGSADAGRPDISRWLFLGLCLLFGVVTLPFVILALLSQPSSLDGYTWAVKVQQEGYWGCQFYLYTKWTGRFASSALLTLAESFLFWRKSVAVVSLAMIGSIFVSLLLLARSLLSQWLGRRTVWSVAMGVFVLYLANMPSCLEGLYWHAGAITYVGGATLAIALLASLLDNCHARGISSRIVRFFGIGMVGVWAAGFSETTMVVLLALVAAGGVWSAVQFHAIPGRWISALLGVGVGTLLVLLAPGNNLRQACFPHTSIPEALMSTLIHARWYTMGWLKNPLLVAAALTSLLLAVTLRVPPGGRNLFFSCLAVGVVGYSAFLLSLFPSYWATGTEYVSRRALNVSYFIFMLTLLSCAGLLGLALNRWPIAGLWIRFLRFGRVAVIGALLIALLMSRNVSYALSDLRHSAFDYAAKWRKRELAIQKSIRAGQHDIVIPRIEARPQHLYMMDITDDPHAWQNREYARFWGVGSIRTQSMPPEETTD